MEYPPVAPPAPSSILVDRVRIPPAPNATAALRSRGREEGYLGPRRYKKPNEPMMHDVLLLGR